MTGVTVGIRKETELPGTYYYIETYPGPSDLTLGLPVGPWDVQNE